MTPLQNRGMTTNYKATWSWPNVRWHIFAEMDKVFCWSWSDISITHTHTHTHTQSLSVLLTETNQLDTVIQNP